MYIADHEIPWEYVWLEFDGLRAKETIELTGLDAIHVFEGARKVQLVWIADGVANVRVFLILEKAKMDVLVR